MTDFDELTIDQLLDRFDFRSDDYNVLLPIARALTERRRLRDFYLDLAEQLDAEGLVVVPKCAPVAVEEGYGDISNAQVIAGTAYQVVGMLSSLAKNFEHPAVQRALDWFSDYDDEKGVTEELLPWGADLFAAAPLPASPSSVEG